MAAFVHHNNPLLGTRAYYDDDYECPDGYYRSYNRCYTAWNYYGRWIFAAVVIFLVILIFFLWACINSRRRRRQGVAPRYGTGWMAPNSGNNQWPQGPQGPHGYQAPPPAYGAPQGQSYPMDPQYTGNTFQTTDGYYGQQSGVQQPKNVYSGNAPNDYAPPEGPPPRK
ncbi:chitin synthesis regulation, resistance to congo red-domain-containing protein [Biscogniauxia marginata]|nr:chitin synthesis regulation, resistance to congo red-domain-containing protein [Biscogniauxia marginata]